MKRLYHFLTGTLRGRLILGVAAVHAVMMALFIADLTARQRAMLLDRQTEEATALSQALATSAAGWIAADDIAGLQELVEAQRRYPEILFAMLADAEGRVLADTDKSRRGLYMLDLPRETRQTTLVKTPALVDIAVPAMLGGHHVGWARVGIGQKAAGERLAAITRSGVVYALAAILIGSVIAWFMGRRITRRLYAVQETIDAVRSGNRLARSSLAGADEAAMMAHEFNAMLDAQTERDAELRASEARYRSLIHKVQTAIVLHDGQGRILDSNPLAQELLGLSAEQLLSKALIDPAWHFLREDGSVLPVAEYPVSLVLSSRQPLRGQVTGISRPDRGDVAWVLVNAEPECNDAGEIEQVIVSFVDITERKRAEEAIKKSEARLNEAQRIAQIGSWELDIVNNVLTWSEEIFRLFEIDPEKFCASYEAFLDAIHPDDREAVNFAYMNSLKTRIPYESAHRIRFADGRIKYVHDQCETLYDVDGKPLRSMGTVQDITERKRAEEALRHLNRELRAISTCNQVLVRAEDEQTLLNDVCRIICDDAGYRMVWVGYAENDDARTVRPVAWAGVEDGYLAAAGITWADTERGRGPVGTAIRSGESTCIQDFTTDLPAAPWRENALRRGYRSSIALPLKDENANTFGVLNIYSMEPNAFTPDEIRLLEELAGDLAFGIVVLRARAEYRQAEEALKESEKRYRRITEGLTDYQYSVRVENGRPVETMHSPTCAIVTGYTAEEYAADPYLWIRMVAPEDCEQVRERIQQILAGKESPPLDHRIIRKDGSLRWVCDTVILLRDASGQLLSYDGVIKDITERRRAEEELDRVSRRNRLILESAGEGIFGLDSEGKVTFANPIAAVMLGYDQQELIGISSHELIHSHHANGTPNPEEDCPICMAYRDGAIHRATKSVFWRKNGTAFPVECTSTPIIENNMLIGAVATFRDVTEKEEMEKRLGQAQKMEAIGTLAGGIAHDFNNILTPIIIHAEMALEDIPAKKTALRFSLEEVLKAAERAKDLVQQILAFSRQTEGKQVVLNVAPVVKEALKLLRASVPTTIEIRRNIKTEPWSILADPTQIHQILMNLCTNAAHAMREKGGVLEIGIANESLDSEAAAGIPGLTPGSYLMLSVGDTGHGMTPEVMERIFEPYFTTKGKGEGTGLGLAVVHGIVASLGGAVAVESEPGKGSRVRVYFPMVDRKPLPAVQSTASLPRGTEHILLVDDEQSMVDAMRPMLEHLGYRVTAGTSSVEALEVFRADPSGFDLLLTDQTMPALTGIELAREILSIKPGIPILLCSGFSDLVDEEKATAAGIRGYIMKPIVMREMAAMIRRALDNR